jgi:hypothetical protein
LTLNETQNGTSLVGNSNIFTSQHASLDGITAIGNTGGLTTDADTIVAPRNLSSVPSGNFNAVRSGPMCVKYDYTGRLDNSSGIITAGLGYTQVLDPLATGNTSVNGLVFYIFKK